MPPATIAIGTCAAFGGLPAAAPNPTGALSVADAVPGLKRLINLPACPANVENLTALLVYFLAYGHWPPLDAYHRPLFAYGKSIHDNCERRAHYDAGQYVEAWGDPGSPGGLLPLQDGLQGPGHLPELSGGALERSHQLAGGDAVIPAWAAPSPDFWDRMTPFYAHLPGVPGIGVGASVDEVGLWATAGVAAGLRRSRRHALRPEPGEEPTGRERQEAEEEG